MSFKTFDLAQDVASVVSSINEVVSISGSIFAFDSNVKRFTNISSASALYPLGGYFQTVYDSTPTSPTSTPLFDVTYGYATGSTHNLPYNASSSQNEKIKVYRMMASSLLGDPDALFTINNVPVSECFFVMIKRGIQKDEIKKGATSIIYFPTAGTTVTASDAGAVTNFRQTVGGDYAPLITSSSIEVGQVWYNAGVLVFEAPAVGEVSCKSWPSDLLWSGSMTVDDMQGKSTIDKIVDGLRLHIDRINIHNQTNLYSTIYFCRATNSEFNYSSNPSFVDSNKRILVTSGSNILQTRTYITTVGLYDANDNLLAVAKVNKPITKAPDSEVTLRVRLDY